MHEGCLAMHYAYEIKKIRSGEKGISIHWVRKLSGRNNFYTEGVSWRDAIYGGPKQVFVFGRGYETL